MKRHIQLEGVRKWAGDHLLELQGEPLAVLDKFFGQFGSYILKGCEVTANVDDPDLYDVASGLVVLEGKDRNGDDAVMVVPFAGVTGEPLPLYLTLAWSVRQGEYVTGGMKPIAYDYHAAASTVEPDEGTAYLLFNADTPRFVDAIQDENHSFITEAERVRWNSIDPDPTAIGEVRTFAAEQEFDNPDYLLCDGSIVGWEDYLGTGLPCRAIVDTVSAFTPLSIASSAVGYNGKLWVTAYPSSNSQVVIATAQDAVNWTQRLTVSAPTGATFVKYIDGIWIVGMGSPAAASPTQIYQSIDDGVSWVKTSGPSTGDSSYNTSIYLIDIEKVGDTWLVSTGGNVNIDDFKLGLYKSTDDMTSWSRVVVDGGQIASWNWRTIVITTRGKAYYSDDLINWNLISLPATALGQPVSITHISDKWIITTSKGELLISENNGIFWQVKQSVFGEGCNIASGRHSLIITTGKQVAVSRDNGENWVISNLAVATGYGVERAYFTEDEFLIFNDKPVGAGGNLNNTNVNIARVSRVLPDATADDRLKTYIRVQK